MLINWWQFTLLLLIRLRIKVHSICFISLNYTLSSLMWLINLRLLVVWEIYKSMTHTVGHGPRERIGNPTVRWSRKLGLALDLALSDRYGGHELVKSHTVTITYSPSFLGLLTCHQCVLGWPLSMFPSDCLLTYSNCLWIILFSPYFNQRPQILDDVSE